MLVGDGERGTGDSASLFLPSPFFVLLPLCPPPARLSDVYVVLRILLNRLLHHLPGNATPRLDAILGARAVADTRRASAAARSAPAVDRAGTRRVAAVVAPMGGGSVCG